MQTQFGQTVVDAITGYRGIVTGHVEYLTGCNQSLVVPPVNEKGEKSAGEWLDDDRLRVDMSVQVVKLVKSAAAPVTRSTGPDTAPPLD